VTSDASQILPGTTARVPIVFLRPEGIIPFLEVGSRFTLGFSRPFAKGVVVEMPLLGTWDHRESFLSDLQQYEGTYRRAESLPGEGTVVAAAKAAEDGSSAGSDEPQPKPSNDHVLWYSELIADMHFLADERGVRQVPVGSGYFRCLMRCKRELFECALITHEIVPKSEEACAIVPINCWKLRGISIGSHFTLETDHTIAEGVVVDIRELSDDWDTKEM